ncbi:MAG: tetratricopeptide repeat protein [Gammaproteobacteria bacterium]|nr:tetratricopeptide repeat protein [Gammaproteobacteria bacterium]
MRLCDVRLITLVAAGLTACATPPQENRISELSNVDANLNEVPAADHAEGAEQSYRRYLEEAPEGENAPEAMRRLADLQLEKVYGVVGAAPGSMMPAPARAAPVAPDLRQSSNTEPQRPAESDSDFESRTILQQEPLSPYGDVTFSLEGEPIPGGPLEAIETYKKLLSSYGNYGRKDKVLYQMSRAYDEIGQQDEAILVMERLVAEYPYSDMADEVHFRRGEYYFVRKRWRDAEEAYRAVVVTGPDSEFYELGLYKRGWSLYKQASYTEALHSFIALLDHRKMSGHVLDGYESEGVASRVSDTFRVVSLCFDNLGGPEVIENYFKEVGQRSYEDRVYANLAEYFFGKLRYDDAASVYRSFVRLHSSHKMAPYFSRRAIEIFEQAGFAQRVVETKKDFSNLYALSSDYWIDNELYSSRDVIAYLRKNLVDLASYYHAAYQNPRFAKDRQANFNEAQNWYRQLLTSSPGDPATPEANYRLADLLLEHQEFVEAAIEYEHAAYDYAAREWTADAAYAAIYSYRQELKIAEGARRRGVLKLAAASSLRFADRFPEHLQVPNVLANAADDLYELKDFPRALEAARKLIARYPHANAGLRRSAWSVVAYSSMEEKDYLAAERAFAQVMALTPGGDEARSSLTDGLAAAIFKQGEQAVLREDYRAGADHFARVMEIEASSKIRITAEYGAAFALVGLADWSKAAAALETFRAGHPQHKLAADATRQLAHVYNEIGELKRSAAEHETLSANTADRELARNELLIAADLYERTGDLVDAVRVYEEYVQEYPEPLDINMDSRLRIAEILRERSDQGGYYEQLEAMVALERDSGGRGSDRMRLLAANAALLLAERRYEQFAGLELTQPFERSLPMKQTSMDETIAALERLLDYEVAEVTAAATLYIAKTYMNFHHSLLQSERPQGLTPVELNSYEFMIEEEAFPFENLAIEVYEANYELMLTGVYNSWIQKSLVELAALMPARYDKQEVSEGLLRSVDEYVYRPPLATPAIGEAAVELTITESAPVSDDVRAAFGEATALLSAGDMQPGIEKLAYLTSQAPMVGAPRINLAIAYRQAGNLEAAEEHLNKALELNAGHPVTLTELGIIYRETGRFADAKRLYETALDNFPGYHPARRNLGILCDLYLADAKCALKQYEEYMATLPDDEEVAIWIADVNHRMGL